MLDLPITILFFTSTKGHFGRKTDWQITLNHLDKQVPLRFFNLVAHVKTTPGDEALGTEMAISLQARGFKVIQTIGQWTRGLSHGANYLGDQVTVSKEPLVYKRPYVLFLEDDSLIKSTVILENLLLQACDMLENDHELLTVRLMRRHDDRGPTFVHPEPNPRYFYSGDVNFQPMILRALDFYRLGMLLEINPEACQQIQCELLWRLILDNFSRSKYKYIVYEPDYAETIHIGVPDADHLAALEKLK